MEAAPDARTALATALRYLSEVLGDGREHIIDVLLEEDVGPLAKEMKVTHAERLRSEGREEGRQEGRDQGREEGRQEGREEERRVLLRKQLALKFGPLHADTEGRLQDATPAELERWVERILVATKIDEVWE